MKRNEMKFLNDFCDFNYLRGEIHFNLLKKIIIFCDKKMIFS